MSDRLLIKCPECGDPNCEADSVDIGVGIQQCGPYCCEACGWVQRHNDDLEGDFTPNVDDKLPF